MSQAISALANPSQVIGVMDWVHGVAVHAVAGRRENYQPLNGSFVQAGNIEQLLHHYFRLGIRSFYIADLDAITTAASRSREAYATLCRCLTNFESVESKPAESQPMAVWLDAGKCSQPWEWLQAGLPKNTLSHMVLGTESLSDIDSIEHFSALAGVDPLTNKSRLAISIDLRDGHLQGDVLRHSLDSLWHLGHHGVNLGIRDWILLDVATVGTGRGPSLLPLCQQWCTRFSNTRLISGGGVRGWSDVQSFIERGCQQVLVATWLHISPQIARMG